MLQYIFLTVDITSRIKCSVLLHKTSEELRLWPLGWTLRKSMVIISAICYLAVVLVCNQTSKVMSLHQCPMLHDFQNGVACSVAHFWL